MRSQTLLILLLLSATLLGSCQSTASDKTSGFNPESVTQDIELLREKYAAPGLAVAIISDGQIIYERGFGYRDAEAELPTNTSTQFGIGSVVKSFTSAMIGLLHDENAVSLESSPADYIPQLVFGDEDLESHLTINNLLSQTSGLPRMDGSVAFFPVNNQSDIAPRTKHFDATCRVGDCWSYNNLNFTLLDMVVEDVTGQSKSDVLYERLLTPIGMSNTLASTTAFEQSADAAIGYGMSDGQSYPVANEFFYDEHIYSTAADMARWLGVWMSQGETQGKTILSKEFVQSAISMQAIDNGAPPTEDDPNSYLHGYGYGWTIKSMEGHYVVHHGGNENGFSTHVMFVPAAKVGVVALTNQQNSILPNVVTDMLLRQILNMAQTPVADYPVIVSDVTLPLSADEVKLSVNESEPMTIDLESVVGSYTAEGYGTLTVSWSGDTLILETPLGVFNLLHNEENKFRLSSTTPIPAGINIKFFELEFLTDQTLTLNIAAQPVRFSK